MAVSLLEAFQAVAPIIPNRKFHSRIGAFGGGGRAYKARDRGGRSNE